MPHTEHMRPVDPLSAPIPRTPAVPSRDAPAGAWATVAGTAFALFPLLRPWGDKTGPLADMATAFASPAWVGAHLSGMAGWMALCAMAITMTIRNGTRGARGAWIMGIGTALVLPYYGAETFALHALGNLAVSTNDPSAVAVEQAVRYGAVPATMFAVGLVMVGIGAVLLARAMSGRERVPATLAAVLVALYLPQFFLPVPGRIAHGLLLGTALLWWAAARWRR